MGAGCADERSVPARGDIAHERSAISDSEANPNFRRPPGEESALDDVGHVQHRRAAPALVREQEAACRRRPLLPASRGHARRERDARESMVGGRAPRERHERRVRRVDTVAKRRGPEEPRRVRAAREHGAPAGRENHARGEDLLSAVSSVEAHGEAVAGAREVADGRAHAQGRPRRGHREAQGVAHVRRAVRGRKELFRLPLLAERSSEEVLEERALPEERPAVEKAAHEPVRRLRDETIGRVLHGQDVAPAAAGDEDLPARVPGRLDDEDAPSAASRRERREKARCAGSHDDDVRFHLGLYCGMPGSKGGIAGVARRLVYRAHFVLACVFGGLYFLAISATALLSILLRVKSPRGGAFLWVRWWGIVMRGVTGWRMDLDHLEHLQGSAPAVVVGNHQSNLDTATFSRFFTEESVAIGKKEIGRIPFFGWLWKASGNILIDRENRGSAIASLEEAVARIRRERLNVWVLAEGHRNQKPELLPFKKGAFHLALAAQVPIVAFVAEPMQNFLDAKRWMLRPGTIRVRFLTPIPTAGRSPNESEALLQEVRSLMQSTLDDLRATGRGPIG